VGEGEIGWIEGEREGRVKVGRWSKDWLGWEWGNKGGRGGGREGVGRGASI